MSDYDEGPELDPSRERDSLINMLWRLCANRLGSAALYVTVDRTIISVWTGRTAPAEGDEQATKLAIQIRSTREDTAIAQVILHHKPGRQYRYVLASADRPRDELDQETAVMDNYLRNTIQDAIFDPRAAEKTLDRILLRRREPGIEEG